MGRDRYGEDKTEKTARDWENAMHGIQMYMNKYNEGIYKHRNTQTHKQTNKQTNIHMHTLRYKHQQLMKLRNDEI